MDKTVELFIQIEPKGKGRPKFTRMGHAYTPKGTRQFESEIRKAYAMSRKQNFGFDRIEVEIQFHHEPPKSWSNKKRDEALNDWWDTKPDIDNLQKAVLDALNGLAWEDDRQIVRITAEKRYSDSSGILLRITSLDLI